jgi:hypothetical protein
VAVFTLMPDGDGAQLALAELQHDDSFEVDVDKGKEDTNEEERLLQPASDESKMEEILSPPRNAPSHSISSVSADSRARGSGRGANRILRVLGVELLRVPLDNATLFCSCAPAPLQD